MVKRSSGFENKSVVFEDESTLNADLILFIPASAGNSMLQASDLPLTDAGFIKIDNHCKVQGFDDVYAIGDIAAIEGPEWVAKQGHIAELMGRNAAYNIIETEKGTNKKKGYQDIVKYFMRHGYRQWGCFCFSKQYKIFYYSDAGCWSLDEKGMGNLFKIDQNWQISPIARFVEN